METKSSRGDVGDVVPSIPLLVLTSIHHAYGAIIYDTPWRLHVLYIAIPIGLAILLMARSPARLWQMASTVLSLIFPVALIGVFEGGYNHVLKNAVYFIGGEAAARSLFSAQAYEMPNDLFFEISGMAQFALAIFAARGPLRLLRANLR